MSEWPAWTKLFAFVPAAILGFALTGCDVDVEDSGELPSVDVKPGEMPEVEVRGPDVDIESVETEIEVPDVDVDMEKRNVTVPSIDVDIPDENDG